MASRPLAAALLALGLPGDPAQVVSRESPLPIEIVAEGAGKAVRVQVHTSVRPLPCDHPSNELLLDTFISAGQSARTLSPTPCICYRQTHGYFRKLDFGVHRVVCWPPGPGAERVLRIPIPLD